MVSLPASSCPCLRAAEPTQKQAGRSKLNEGLAGLHRALIVLGESAVANQPREGTFNHPSSRLDTEAAHARLTLHDFQLPTLPLMPAPVGQLFATIGGIRPDLLEPRHEERQTTQELALRAPTVSWTSAGVT